MCDASAGVQASVRRGGGGFSSRAAAVAQLRAQCRGNHTCGRGDAYGILRSGITTSGSKPMTGLTKWRNRMVACGFLRPRAVSGYRCGNYSTSRARCFLGVRTSAARFHQKHCFSQPTAMPDHRRASSPVASPTREKAQPTTMARTELA